MQTGNAPIPLGSTDNPLLNLFEELTRAAGLPHLQAHAFEAGETLVELKTVLNQLNTRYRQYGFDLSAEIDSYLEEISNIERYWENCRPS